VGKLDRIPVPVDNVRMAESRAARLAGMPLFKDAGLDLTAFEARSRWRRFEPDEILVDFDDLTTTSSSCSRATCAS
jgi:hypothetical protein